MMMISLINELICLPSSVFIALLTMMMKKLKGDKKNSFCLVSLPYTDMGQHGRRSVEQVKSGHKSLTEIELVLCCFNNNIYMFLESAQHF